MNRNNLYVIFILLLSAVLMSIGITRKIRSLKRQNEFTIAVIPKGTANMWWEVVRKGAADAAKQCKVKMLWNGPETENDREKQIQCVEDAITRKSSAIVLGPNDFKALVRSVEKIRRNRIPCVIVDSPVDTKAFDSFVGTDNYRGGAEAARILGKKLKGRGKVILVRFLQNSSSTDERARGFLETMQKEFPLMTLGAQQHTQGTVEDARQRTVDMLTKHPDAAGVFAVNHPSSVGACKAIQAEGRAGQICFVAFDSDPVLLEGIEKGEVAAVIAQDPYAIGFNGVKQAVAILRKEKYESYMPIESMIVTKENLQVMKKRNPEALGL
ncbi:MAG: substrate-binding domain-containing protein [Lentisphaeria bacterium]|nr:substrate-binding domain-containing protein [Lentisphaeria bacterium]